MKQKLFIFLDELYFANNADNKKNSYLSTFIAGSFFDEISFIEKSFMFPVSNGELPFPDHSSTLIENVKCYPLPCWTSVTSFVRFYSKANNRKKLNKILDQTVLENDLFWIRHPSLPGLLLTEKALQEGKKVYLHIAGEIADAWKNSKYKGLLRIPAFAMSKFMQWRLDRFAKHPDSILLCTGSKLLQHYKNITQHTHFFIDSLIKQNQLSSHSLDQNKFRFIYVGRLTVDKGIYILLEVFKILSNRCNNIQLDIIGFGPEENGIKKYIQEHQIEHIINFIGFVHNTELYRYLNQSDIFVLPSHNHYEGFPRVIIEAWANGLAVISTKVGGIEGLGKEGENILFCEPGSVESLLTTCERLIRDRVLLGKIHNSVIKNREKITKEYYQALLYKIFEE